MGNMLGNMLGNSGSMDFGNISFNSITSEAKNNFIEGMTNPLTTERGTMNSNAGRLAASFLGVQGGELKTVSLIPSSNTFRPRTNTFRPSISKSTPLNKTNAEGSTNNHILSNASIAANAQNRSRSRPLNGGNYKSKRKYKKRKRSKKYIK